jgi:hypothetical protein
MNADIPAYIQSDETVSLIKEWYRGLVFDIPGAEVRIGDEWIPYTATNAALINQANPMELEWRLNATTLIKYGYTPGQTVTGKIITVDDGWNGLNLEKEFSVQLQ